MKKRFALQWFLFFTFSATFFGCEKETILSNDEFPSEIITYVDTHFPTQEIIQMIKERDDFKRTFNVILSSNTSLEFNKDFEVVSISSPTRLPDSVVPERVLEFATAQYPDQFIVEWDIDKKDQQVELNNGIELIFNKEGTFLRIDD